MRAGAIDLELYHFESLVKRNSYYFDCKSNNCATVALASVMMKCEFFGALCQTSGGICATHTSSFSANGHRHIGNIILNQLI